jgi:hypothetical protein
MTQKSSIAADQTLSELFILREGDQVGFSVPVSGASSISSVTLAFYKKGQSTNTEASGAVYWTTTACTVTGNTVVTGTTQNLKAGEWILSINGTVDGLIMNIITIPINIKRRSEP